MSRARSGTRIGPVETWVGCAEPDPGRRCGRRPCCRRSGPLATWARSLATRLTSPTSRARDRAMLGGCSCQPLRRAAAGHAEGGRKRPELLNHPLVSTSLHSVLLFPLTGIRRVREPNGLGAGDHPLSLSRRLARGSHDARRTGNMSRLARPEGPLLLGPQRTRAGSRWLTDQRGDFVVVWSWTGAADIGCDPQPWFRLACAAVGNHRSGGR